MIDATKDRPRSNLELVKAILMTNFAALHTTTMSFTYVMYELATRPKYVQPLREEIEAVTGEEGWSRDAMHKLWKVDSFIKECLRVSNFSFLAAARIALKDLTFSNGMTIPAGSMIGVPFDAIHTDANNYVDPESFDGFRFEKMRSQEGENIKHQIMSLSPDFILFGHGRQACPGRFFVANELKAMLAHALLKYDFKMANGRGRPSNWQFWIFMVPDVTAKILFRKRTAARGPTMRRKALKDFTFSDGTAIPAGTSVSIPYVPVHTDPNNYTLADPKNFDGFRFEKMRKQNGENSKHQFVSLSVDYILFGHGRHACTGQFFVATEMKVLLAHILLKYDVKMADRQGQPKNWQFGRYSGPDTTAKILFRKRREA